jgi:hypothetical protein
VVFVEDHDVIAAGIALPVPLQGERCRMAGTGVTGYDRPILRADQVRTYLGDTVFVGPQTTT